MKPITFIIPLQCPSGKNAITITRTGLRFPNKRFVEWRKEASKYITYKGKPIDTPVSVRLVYTAGDLRKRDIPGIIDAIWHLLEYNGVVADDALLGGLGQSVIITQYYFLRLPSIEMTLYEN